jgi:hypothetical protein
MPSTKRPRHDERRNLQLPDADIRWLRKFGKWEQGRKLIEKDDTIWNDFKTAGVYVILASRPVSRCVGKSRILNIGQGENIGNRVGCVTDPTYYDRHPASAFGGVQHLKREQSRTELSFMYLKMGNEQRRKAKENELLLAYEKEFVELPLFNCQHGKRKQERLSTRLPTR